MDCCCCTTASTEVHYTESPRYKRAAHAIDGENTDFFAQVGWSANLDEKQIIALFDYAVGRKSSSEIIDSILRENIKTLVASRGFIHVLFSALTRKTDQACLEFILQYKPNDLDLAHITVREGLWRKPLLHLCAEHGNLPWLKYFVENLGFLSKKECWLDPSNYDPLYYAATRGHLDTTTYLVVTVGLEPTAKICKNAKGAAREYLQPYSLKTYTTEPSPRDTFLHMYQKPKRCSTEAAQGERKLNEATPLLRSAKK